MRKLELCRGEDDPIVKIEIVRRGLDVWVGAEGHGYRQLSEEEALTSFAEKVQEFVRQGYRETLRSLSRREFVFEEGTARKFWSIELDNAAHHVWFGRIGTDGQETTKRFDTPVLASKSYEKLIATKLKAGYRQLARSCGVNPTHPLSFSSAWRTDTAVAIARGMNDSRDFTSMPILADALQDAGCENADILTHCRGPGPHVRGCWVVDLVLVKE